VQDTPVRRLIQGRLDSGGSNRRTTRRLRDGLELDVPLCRIAVGNPDNAAGAGGYLSARVILGDMNDYRETDSQGSSGILQLVDWDQVENVVERLPADEQWTHYFKGRRGRTPVAEGYHQLDYLLLSRSLARSNKETIPLIFREGLPTRATRYDGRRFDGIGKDKPKASDHCPVAFDLTL
jgi:endonuclease/exonuclease/phosphatase family metal-dependent hydrolase